MKILSGFEIPEGNSYSPVEGAAVHKGPEQQEYQNVEATDDHG
jgi:hypothetical protein